MHRRTINRNFTLLIIGVLIAVVMSLLQWAGCIPLN